MQQNRGEYLFRSSSPLHSGGLAPAAGSMTTSPSSLAHLNNPYMQSFNQGTTGGTGRPSAVVRRAAPTFMTAADTLQEQGSKAPEERAMLRSELSRGCESPAVETNERQTEVHRTLELQRLLRVERGMRLSAERRILEEREKGTRAAIVIEANYGARMLYSIFLEAIATLPSARTSGAAADAWDKAGRPLRSPSRRHLLAPSRNGEEAPHAASALAADDGRLAEENRLLRAQVERYRSIETEDRQELNELHRNMQTAIDRLTRECEALHTELTRYKTERQPLQWAAERGRVVPTDERSMWHYAHFIDPSAANMEESPELACRLRGCAVTAGAMAEQRLLALRCWDACLRYELARSELWGRLQSGATSDVAASSTAHGATDWLEGDAVPSIADETVAIALRHIACEYLTASVEAINGMLRNFKSWNTNTTGHSVGAQRVSLRIFTSLLGSLALVASPAKVIEALWSSLLHIDGLLAECVSEARESRTVVESDESEAREQLLSSKRRWEHTRMLRERLQQHVHLATLHTAADAGVGADRSVSLIRRVVRIEEERQQQRSAEEAARVERLGHVGDTLKTLQEQLRVAGEYEALSLASLRDEQARRVAQLLDESRATHSAGRVGLMERQLGVLGRFAIGLSVANLGRREHEAILCRMRDAGTSNDAAAGDFTWLITDSAEFEHDYCAASVPTPGHDASPLQQCVLDASYYKASEATSTRRGCDIPPEDERRHVEAVLQETFASLARLNYVALPFLQCDAAALDAVVLFPSFELFVTQCELSVIGSSRLAFVRHSTSQLDADVAAYVKSLVQRKGSWIVDYAMSYDDFLAFLVDQAAVEYVRHAYLLTPRALLTRIVQEFVVPKWLARLKRDEQAAVHSNAIRERPTGCVTTASRPDAADDDDKNNKDNNDLCLLLDTAVTWLSIANRSLRDFAVAYRTHVVDYACAMKPEGEQTSCNTTRALMALLFPPQGNTRLRCNADRWEALQRSYGSTFAELSELVEDDGSLDGVTAWLSLVIDGISREDLMQRIADTVDAILRASLDDDDDGDACPARGKLRSCLSHNTPLSWILTLALCVRLSFDSSVVTPRLDGMLRFLTVSC